MRQIMVGAVRDEWKDVDWENNGILSTRSVKNSGTIGTVKEKKNKIVRLPVRTVVKDHYMEHLGKRFSLFISCPTMVHVFLVNITST